MRQENFLHMGSKQCWRPPSCWKLLCVFVNLAASLEFFFLINRWEFQFAGHHYGVFPLQLLRPVFWQCPLCPRTGLTLLIKVQAEEAIATPFVVWIIHSLNASTLWSRRSGWCVGASITPIFILWTKMANPLWVCSSKIVQIGCRATNSSSLLFNIR